MAESWNDKVIAEFRANDRRVGGNFEGAQVVLVPASPPSTRGAAMTTTTTQAARIRELMLVNLFAVFSQRDPERRMQVIVANYTEDVIWSDPEATARGHEALNERAQQLLDRTPDFVFTAAGPIHVLGDLGYLPFTYGVPQQPPASIGYDVALVRDGRIAVLYTLLNGFTDRA